MTLRNQAGSWFSGKGGGREGGKALNFFFFELGSQRAHRAATRCRTPTCSTAGIQASEGFNGILPEAVLLRCRLFLLPLQLTPFTVSCPPLLFPSRQCTKLLASFSAHGFTQANQGERAPFDQMRRGEGRGGGGQWACLAMVVGRGSVWFKRGGGGGKGRSIPWGPASAPLGRIISPPPSPV